MKVVIKRPMRIAGTLYKKSAEAQEIPDSEKDHWFVQALMKDGDIVLLEKPAVKAEVKAKGKPKAKAEAEA